MKALLGLRFRGVGLNCSLLLNQNQIGVWKINMRFLVGLGFVKVGFIT